MKKTGSDYIKPFAKEIFGVENVGYYPYPREELIKQPIFPYFVLDGGAFNLMNDKFGSTNGDDILELTLSGELFEIFKLKGEFNWESSFAYIKGTDFRKKYEWQIWPRDFILQFPLLTDSFRQATESMPMHGLQLSRNGTRLIPISRLMKTFRTFTQI